MYMEYWFSVGWQPSGKGNMLRKVERERERKYLKIHCSFCGIHTPKRESDD